MGCAEAPIPGSYYEVVLQTARDGENGLKDECNRPPEDHRETYTYVVQFDGANAQILIDGNIFATGAISGCNLSYQSSIFTEDRENGGTVRWSVRGDATISSGEGCSAGDGWVGEERIDVVNSTDDDVPAGCSYFMDATGPFLEEVE